MDIVVLITSLFVIGIGFLTKSAPDLIAGYNTMPKDKKKNVDIESFSTFMRNGLIIIGLLVVVIYFPVKWLGYLMAAIITMPAVILVGSLFLAIKTQKFDHNRKKN